MPAFPRIKEEEIQKLSGTRQLLQQMGPEKFSQWILDQKKLLITDTTMRDAHQSLMATRMRTIDMEKIALAVALYGKDLFSLRCGAGQLLMWLTVSLENLPGRDWLPCGEDSEHSVPDVIPGRECCGIQKLSGQCDP